jgi:glycerol kinase
MKSEPVACNFPRPGWVEQHPEEIWQAQMSTARAVLSQHGSPVSAVGITNQRETAIVWDCRTGKAVAPAIVWQCRRTAAFCQELARCSTSAVITRKTGLVIDAYFSASKLKWILDNVPGAREKAANGELLFGTVDSWLVWRLTNGEVHVTDYSNASRTMLMDLESGEWDAELLDLFGVPRAMMPRIAGSSEIVGTAAGDHFGYEIPIAGIAGDQQAAMAGQACFRPGLSKNTYGTGCFALLHTGATVPASQNRLLATRAASLKDRAEYAIEGSIFIAGAVVQWLRDNLQILASAPDSAAVARSVADTSGVYFVPAFVGLGAPYWDPDARGTISGITQGTSRAHIVRAALESIAYQTRELVDAMEADSGSKLEELRVDGGASANDFLMQFQADILGRPIVRPADVETTALGAAYLAGMATGIWTSAEELEKFWIRERVFEPEMLPAQRDELYTGWKQAVQRARGIQSPSATLDL